MIWKITIIQKIKKYLASFPVIDEFSYNNQEINIKVYKLPLILNHDCQDYQNLKLELDHKILCATKNIM